jgi:septal ring factor EnvC (AmiA/AmiB activator)
VSQLFALDPGMSGLLSAAAVIIAAATGLYIAVRDHRASNRNSPTGDNYTRTIDGFNDLLAAQDKRIDDLTEEVVTLRSEVQSSRAESRRANSHAAECERELRAAKRRIAMLEAS